MDKRGADVLIEVLAGYRTEFIFGVPGGQTLSMYDAIAQQDFIKHVLVRDEKAGALSAIGYSRATFTLGVCDATVGPGVANLVPAVAEAYTGSTPIILLTSNVTSDIMGKGASQELDHFALFHPFVKSSIRPQNPDQIPVAIQKAFKLATSGRPGPVHVDLPQDILEGRLLRESNIMIENKYIHFPAYRPRPELGAISEMIKLIEKADSPIILAGGGTIISQAWEELRVFAELIVAPVVTTLTGKGVISDDHPLSLGCVGRQGYRPTANKALKEADLVIALGTKLGQVSTNNWRSGQGGSSPTPDHTRYVQISLIVVGSTKSYGDRHDIHH